MLFLWNENDFEVKGLPLLLQTKIASQTVSLPKKKCIQISYLGNSLFDVSKESSRTYY